MEDIGACKCGWLRYNQKDTPFYMYVQYYHNNTYILGLVYFYFFKRLSKLSYITTIVSSLQINIVKLNHRKLKEYGVVNQINLTSKIQ